MSCRYILQNADTVEGAGRLSQVLGMHSQELALECVPHAILPLTAAEDNEGLNHLAWAVGTDALQIMEGHGHVVIAKRLFEGCSAAAAAAAMLLSQGEADTRSNAAAEARSQF